MNIKTLKTKLKETVRNHKYVDKVAHTFYKNKTSGYS